MSSECLFISDCHLHADRQDISDNLVEFLTTRAIHARALFILGDLFEVWLGDDDPSSTFDTVLESLSRLSHNTRVYFLAGNRDFLVGHQFAQKYGIEIITEPHILTLDGQRVLLMHGDLLCTDDRDYQRFRSLVRSANWQSEFLAKPLAQRQQIAAGLRADSSAAMSTKSMGIMDVNEQAVASCFSEHKVEIIIHGHTHRPDCHRYENHNTRFVLGDWNPTISYLSWSESRHFELHDQRVDAASESK